MTATPAASIACNGCNAARSIKIQPCLICGSPEYRLLPATARQNEPGPSADFHLTGEPRKKGRKR